MKISAVIITKNEETNISRCLESLEDVVDEIIVFDSKSTDKTQQIAQEFSKAQWITTEWKGYAKTKNEANAAAAGPYILSLDADECLSLDLKKEILDLKPKLQGEAYRLNRLTNYCGQWIYRSGWYPDRKTRLFPKQEARWSEKAVHEEVEVKKGLVVKNLQGHLYHYSYYSIQDHISRIQKYSLLAAEIIARSEKKHLRAKSILNSFLKFMKSYFFQGGILDGYYGFVICYLSSVEVFLKYSMAEQIRQRRP